MAHRTQVVLTQRQRYFGTCKCGISSEHYVSKQQAEDWVLRHERLVQQALATLHKAPGSLRTDMEHAQKMMEDPNVPARERDQWRVIFEGARNRLGLGKVLHEAQEEKLWE